MGAVLLPWVTGAHAQVATLYTFGQAAGTYTEITGGTALWTNTFDDVVSGAQTIPGFTYNGTVYTTMFVSANGFVTFGAAPTTTNYAPIGSGETYQRCVSAFGADLVNAASGTRDVRWQTVGNEVVVQWRGVRRYNFIGLGESLNFQVRLNISTGDIRTIYGPYGSGPANSTTGQPQVGLRGPNNTFATNVNNRLVGTGAENWSSSLQGTGNGSTLRFTSGSPAKSWTNGLTYTWTPINCNTPTANATVIANCATNTYTISVNVSALNGAPSVNIQSPTGTNVFTNVGTGTHLVAGIPFGSARTVTVVHNGNGLCNVNLGSFNFIDGDLTCNAVGAFPIPDNGCGANNYVNVPFCVSSPGTALGTNVFVRSVDLIVSHTYNADIELSLVSPGGTTVSLINDRFGSGDNLGNPASCPGSVLTLRADGAALSAAAANNVTGVWAPEQPLSNFHNGSNPTGTWTLRACDDLGADVGAIRYVNLNLCLPPQATFTAVDNCGSNQFSVQVNVTSLGTGATANLNYTVNGNPFFLPNIGAGTTTVGPFAVGSEINLTVDNGLANCGNAQGTVYSNCPVVITCGTTVAMNHCYRNNDPRTFTFHTNTPGETISLTFIAGTMHPNDLIRAYSGVSDLGTPIASLTGTFANFSGGTVTGQSLPDPLNLNEVVTGQDLFLEIESDASNSCATGQQSSWSFEAECTPGCVDPDGVVTVNTNCAAYNFTIDVEVTFTGDALLGTTTLQYTVNGGAPLQIPGLVVNDVENIGPFAMDDIVNVRLLHEDQINSSSCNRNLGNFTDNNSCPSAENCVNALNLAGQTSPMPATTVGRTHDFTFACGTATTNTAGDAIYFIDVADGLQLRIRQQVNNYNSQHYVRYGGACPGSTVIACVNDDNGEVGWVEWTNTTGSTQRVWWIQDGFGTATGTFTLEWQVLTCPIPTAGAATGVTNSQAGANFTGPAGNYIVEWGPAATFTTPGAGLAPGTNGTVISTSSSPAVITGLSANTAYRYFVRHDCGGGNFSPNTAGIDFTTTNAPTPVVNGSCGNNVAISDNGCGTNTYTLVSIAISGQPNALGTNVGLANVDLILTHTFRSDLIISLVSPGGQEVLLSNQRGGSGDNFGNNASCPTAAFRFVAGGAALATIPATTANVTGNYAPEQPLAGFNSGNPNGIWLLKVCDNAGIDVGALRHLELNFLPIDCLGALGGPAMPGTACNDNDVCTINDTWNATCACAGTFQDTDGDGTCNANDGCPNDPEKTAPGQCGCGIADTDNDNDGTANCNDGCPDDPNKLAPGICGCGVSDADTDGDLTADCNDGCPNDPNKIAPGVCGCGVADTNTDGDALADCIDPCPFLANLQNGDICDANPGAGYTLGVITSCACTPVACATNLQLEFQSDGMSNVTWELRQQGSGTVVQSGGGFLPPTPSYVESTCLPNGCFYLKVMDGEGDGITGGGYILRTLGASGKRLIDNRNNFTSGSVSQIANNEGFCLPLGIDRLLITSCDKLDWIPGEFIVANDNPDVSAQWGVGNQTDDGYEMWFFNPNGGYSFRRFHSHAVSDNFAPANAVRACHIQINNWATVNHIQNGVLLNVRVRSRVNGTNSEWGPACRFKLDPLRAQCPLTKLMDYPGSPYFSCGAARNWGNGNYVHARPVAGGNKYQFRFRIQAENFVVVKTTNTYFLHLNWTVLPLEPCKTYEVDVRVSKDNGLTWCTDFVPPVLIDPWGDVCLLTITCAMQGGGQNMLMEEEASSHLKMYPNPNRGDQLMLRIDEVGAGVNTVSVEVHDNFNRLVIARTLAVQDGSLNTVFDLSRSDLAAGVYLVNVTVGTRVYTERLVIQP